MDYLNNPGILTPLANVLCDDFHTLQMMFVNKLWYKTIHEILLERGKKSNYDLFDFVADLNIRYMYKAFMVFKKFYYTQDFYVGKSIVYDVLPNDKNHGVYESICNDNSTKKIYGFNKWLKTINYYKTL